MNVTKGTAPSLNVTYNTATNRRTTDTDVANRIATTTIPGGTARYSYAPNNLRLWRGLWTGSTQTTDELTYYSGSAKLTAYNLTVSGSNLRATSTGYYEFFGSKMIKNAAGYVNKDRQSNIGKYFPYGQERPSATANGKEKFATYFRDSETGLDYALNRYHSSGDGRFLTPDPYRASAGPEDPGSWNRYAYVGGDPVNYIDPGGLCRMTANGNAVGIPSDCSITVTETANPLGTFTYTLPSSLTVPGTLSVFGEEPIVCLPGPGCMPLHEACKLYGNDGGYGYGCGVEVERRPAPDLNAIFEECFGEALAKNVAALVLDVAGMIPGASLRIRMTNLAAGIVSTALSAYQQTGDVGGTLSALFENISLQITAISNLQVVTQAAQGSWWNAIPWVNVAMGAVSTLNDAAKIYEDLDKCFSERTANL